MCIICDVTSSTFLNDLKYTDQEKTKKIIANRDALTV